jgi:hypothetical protein
MSGVLHPVGPEPASTYWLRRALVLGALAVVMAVMFSLIGNGAGGQRAVSAVPAPVATPSPSEPTSAATGSTDTTSESSRQSSSEGSDPAASKSSEPTDKKSTEPKKSSGPAKQAEADKTAESAKPSKAAEPSKKTAYAPLCDPGKLRPTLTGKKSLEPKEDNTFSLSVINGSSTTCVVSVTAESFELKIYSGKDRIWTTGHCPTAVRSVVATLASQQAVEWKMTWNGLRSAPGCTTGADVPQPGTYFATAQLADVKPVQLRMAIQN